jgi:hypothetical protein
MEINNKQNNNISNYENIKAMLTTNVMNKKVSNKAELTWTTTATRQKLTITKIENHNSYKNNSKNNNKKQPKEQHHNSSISSN